ncbi:hypothetical protein C475_03234 [Halosimplex carlsbadense 2-9-1]|uniref:Uncharacterized protein n=1 Tax=Halosimplex carlsbadense 2-9-1 TaxID=797114 RepID=M0D3C5_9EURY|nr:hypothetical protein [Halosimplex carlsbadense]ELZ29197.1 hypothetical protein C475_03234 [Halosimplex carlsbadense 2-9-1]
MFERRRDRERGQSQVIGYVLVFSAVVLAVGGVVTFGVSALDQVQSSTVADNGEFAMQSVAADVEALYYGTATSRNTELTLDSATLETGAPTTVNVTANRGSGKVAINRTFRPIVYKTDDVNIAYENTLVIRDQARGSVAVTEPHLTISGDRSVVPVVETNSSVQSVGGATHQIHAVLANSSGRSLTKTASDPVRLNVTVQSVPDRVDVWERQLNESVDGMTRPASAPLAGRPACRRPDPGHVTCIVGTDRAVISHSKVVYDFR